jgi:hypothetical protein
VEFLPRVLAYRYRYWFFDAFQMLLVSLLLSNCYSLQAFFKIRLGNNPGNHESWKEGWEGGVFRNLSTASYGIMSPLPEFELGLAFLWEEVPDSLSDIS